MKKVLFILALWYLGEWAYKNKLKPFIKAEFNLAGGDNDSTGTAKGNTRTSDTGVFNKEMNNGAYLRGLDISHYQGNEAEYLERKKDSVVFVICKATDGLSPDKKFINNRTQIKNRKMVFGAYHFFRIKYDPVSQVDKFMKAIGPVDKSDLPPFVDIEAGSFDEKFSETERNKRILTFLTELQTRTGRTPVIYTDLNTGNTKLSDNAFGSYPLWIAFYRSSVRQLVLPENWADGNRWVFWQKSDTYKLDGYKDDFDLFNGNKEGLSRFISSH